MALTDIFKKKKEEGKKPSKKQAPKKESGLKLKKAAPKKAAPAKKEAALKPKKADAKVGGVKTGYKVLIRPVVTEKAADLMSHNKYVFEVAPASNKAEIKKAVQSLYSVSPLAVQVMKQPGKAVRRGRITGKRKTWKKAIVTLKKGDKIEVYEGV